MKRIPRVLMWALALSFFIAPFLCRNAYADTDEIVSYDVVATPQAADGSIAFTVTLDWKMLESLPDGERLMVGIPNGSVHSVTALTENIDRLANDNSYMYIYLDRGYRSGEVAHFSYSWVQEYMYTLDEDGAVSFDYTPGWFEDCKIDRMTLTWQESDGLDGEVTYSADDSDRWTVEGMTLVGENLLYGSKVHLYAVYTNWPTALSDEDSAAYLPDEYEDYDSYGDDGGEIVAVFFLLLLIAVIVVIVIAAHHDGYAGGFGTHYVYVGHLWYPAGPDGHPRPGSVGVPHKPKPPVNHSSGGFGGGSRGGGFGGGGFGGGSHCACASSCACACACACAGGGRAGCSAKNLYGAVRLGAAVTEKLSS